MYSFNVTAGVLQSYEDTDSIGAHFLTFQMEDLYDNCQYCTLMWRIF